MVLRCTSSEGTNPLQYTWEKTSDNKLLPASAVLGKTYLWKPGFTIPRWSRCFETEWLFTAKWTEGSLKSFGFLNVLLSTPPPLSVDPVGGTMNVRNASTSSSGTYRCTAKNHVGMEECILQLGITPRESLNAP